MSEFIIIQVGQCGNQIGSALWPLILQEYNINLTESSTNNQNKCDHIQKSFTSFFHSQKPANSYNSLNDLLMNHVKARAICIDMEEGVLARYKSGILAGLFDKNCFVSNYPGSGNNWAEGYYEHGSHYKTKILKAIQYAVERCTSLHGFILLFSMGGGTGSGLGTYILRLLADYYPQIERFVACVYPIGTEDVITCPYNMAFATQQLIKYSSCVFPIENRQLLNILSKKTYNCDNNYISMFKPFEDMNSIIVNMLLHLTSGSRFAGSLNFDMNELNTNMVPFPKLNFLSTGYSPILQPVYKNGKQTSKQLKDEIFLSSCARINQLVKTDPLSRKSALLSTTLIGRGEYTLTDMRNYIEKIQTKGKFTPWSKKAVKIGLCDTASYNSSVSMLSIFNTTSINNLFKHIEQQFSLLYQKRAHVHHYTKVNGFNMDDFNECKESLKDIMESYDMMENIVPANIPRLSIFNKNL